MKNFCFVIVYVLGLGLFIVSNVECREYVDLRVAVSVLGGSRVLSMPSYLLLMRQSGGRLGSYLPQRLVSPLKTSGGGTLLYRQHCKSGILI